MRYYIGAVLKSAPDWQEYIEVKAPKNYKDPAKIEEYIAARTSEMESGTVTHPLAGTVSAICILTTSDDGKQIVESDKAWETDDTGAGRRAIEFILSHSGLLTDSGRTQNILIGGCRLSAALRLMAIDYIIANGSLPYSLHWMLTPGKSPSEPLLVDPARTICGHAGPHVPEIPLAQVARKFGLPAPDEDNAVDMAVMAHQLCSRLGL